MQWKGSRIFRELELSQITGVVLGLFFLILGWVDVGYEMATRSVFQPGVGAIPWLAAAFFMSTAVFTSTRSRVIQVFSMFAIGVYMTATRGVSGVDGVLVMVLSYLFADTYGLMERHRPIKSITVIAGTVLIIEVVSTLRLGQPFGMSLPYLVVVLYLVYQLVRYYMVEHRLDTQSDQLRQQIEANHVFIEVGQNTSGLVHDLKNDLCRISYPRQHAQRQVRRLLEKNNPEFTEGLQRIAGNLQAIKDGEEKLEHSLNVVRRIPAGFVRTKPRILNITRYVHDLCSFLMFRKEFSHAIRISIDADADILWYGAESDIGAVCKNLVENACQAEMEGGGYGMVRLQLHQQVGWFSLTVLNRGSIPWVQGSQNLLDDSAFAIGKTTKDNGTGYGMVNVRRALHRMGGEGVIQQEDGMIAATVRLPLYQPEEDARDAQSTMPPTMPQSRPKSERKGD